MGRLLTRLHKASAATLTGLVGLVFTTLGAAANADRYETHPEPAGVLSPFDYAASSPAFFELAVPWAQSALVRRSYSVGLWPAESFGLAPPKYPTRLLDPLAFPEAGSYALATPWQTGVGSLPGPDVIATAFAAAPAVPYSISTFAPAGTFSSSYRPVSPVPEPEIYVTMLVGLGLLGFAARRKLNRHSPGP